MSDYSIIIPSRGLRPRALGRALDSVYTAAQRAKLEMGKNVEVLVGFDGVRGERVRTYPGLRYFDLPADGDYGNAVRHALIKASQGQRLVFLDDDNELTAQAFAVYAAHADADMLVARIDVSRAHDTPWLPVTEEDKPLIRPCNIDPLCLCLCRELVLVRCGGWLGTKYEADYHNILRYSRRARQMVVVEDVVGIYDAGRELDAGGSNFRQKALAAKGCVAKSD